MTRCESHLSVYWLRASLLKRTLATVVAVATVQTRRVIKSFMVNGKAAFTRDAIVACTRRQDELDKFTIL